MTSIPIMFEDHPIPHMDAATIRADADAVRSLLQSGHIAVGLTLFDAKRRSFTAWLSQQRLHQLQQQTVPRESDVTPSLEEMASHWAREVLDIQQIVLRDHAETALSHLGPHVMRLWQADVTVARYAAHEGAAEEARCVGQFRRAWAAHSDGLTRAQGESQDLPSETPEGAVAERVDAAPDMAACLDQLIKTRNSLAAALGFNHYRDLAYERLYRFDYGPAEILQFHASIRAHVVPLLKAYMQRRQLETGGRAIDQLEAEILTAFETVSPIGGARLLYDRTLGILSDIDADQTLSQLCRQLLAQDKVALENDPDGPAWETVLPAPFKDGAPFIAIKCNGQPQDVAIVTNALGRAYQYWQGASLSLYEYLLPTPEAAGIAPRALSLLAMGHVERLLKEGGAADYRRQFLLKILFGLVRAACIDGFEHAIYDHPEWSHDQRMTAWHELEKIYFPWREGQDGVWDEERRAWQQEDALFDRPFSAINTALSHCCAMQIWLSSRIDSGYAIELFKSLCALGGTYPFLTLLEKAGLISPFGTDVLPEIMHEIEELLWN